MSTYSVTYAIETPLTTPSRVEATWEVVVVDVENFKRDVAACGEINHLHRPVSGLTALSR